MNGYRKIRFVLYFIFGSILIASAINLTGYLETGVFPIMKAHSALSRTEIIYTHLAGMVASFAGLIVSWFIRPRPQ